MVIADALVNDAVCPIAGVSPHNNKTKTTNTVERPTTARQDADV